MHNVVDVNKPIQVRFGNWKDATNVRFDGFSTCLVDIPGIAYDYDFNPSSTMFVRNKPVGETPVVDKIDLSKPIQVYTNGEWRVTTSLRKESKFEWRVYVPGYSWFHFDASNPPYGFRNTPECRETRLETETKPEENRKVSAANRIDFKKPLEIVIGEGNVFSCEYVGEMDENSRNFPSWFICKTDLDCGEEFSRYFVVRGDGKTDMSDAVVRNKSVPRLKVSLGDASLLDLDYDCGWTLDNMCFTLPSGEQVLLSVALGEAVKDKLDNV